MKNRQLPEKAVGLDENQRGSEKAASFAKEKQRVSEEAVELQEKKTKPTNKTPKTLKFTKKQRLSE